ncbi:MAG: hypothetical protein KDA21_13190 [Phycisphaerales bacterium]|nr:hypothetical protein [Phycisphaerales bacterium]
MTVTAKLLSLYRVDQQLSGLQSRLKAAERYLAAQERQLTELNDQTRALQSQMRQMEAAEHNDETETKGLEERIATLRERMNNAKTSKEHSAFLTEINTLKADKGLIEERAIETLNKLEELRGRVSELAGQVEEREKVREVARTDRDRKEAEIRERLEELKGQRAEAVRDVPESALALYEERLAKHDPDEVMAAVEEQDRRSMEYTCGNCYTHLPIEPVNRLLKRTDELISCPACQVILYIEEDLRETISNSHLKKNKKAVPSD